MIILLLLVVVLLLVPLLYYDYLLLLLPHYYYYYDIMLPLPEGGEQSSEAVGETPETGAGRWWSIRGGY